MRTVLKSLIFGGLLAAASAASAQVSLVGPFAGDYLEDFESFPDQSVQVFLPNPTDIFGGFGHIVTTGDFPALAIYHSYGSYTPYDGNQFIVTQSEGDMMTLLLDGPMTDFGGYWGQDELLVSFYDANNNLISSDTYTPDFDADGTLQWLGWHSDVAFSKVEISSVHTITADSFRVGARVVTPEPFTMGLGSAGVLLYLRRRRRQPLA